MKLPLPYMLPALDGSSSERAAVLQEIRDRGILEASDLTAFCFKVEALLDRAEQHEATEIRLREEILDRETQLMQDLIDKLNETRQLVISAFDDLLPQLPLNADLLFAKCAHILKEMPECPTRN